MRKAVTRRVVVIASLVLIVFSFFYKVTGDTRGEDIFGTERIEVILSGFLGDHSDSVLAGNNEGGDSALM